VICFVPLLLSCIIYTIAAGCTIAVLWYSVEVGCLTIADMLMSHKIVLTFYDNQLMAEAFDCSFAFVYCRL